MAGDLKQKYAGSAALTFTSLNSLAGSSTFVAGAGCLAIDNTSTLYEDVLVGGLVTWSSTAPAAGTYRMDTHVYSAHDDTPTYPKDGSGNALGTDVARTFASMDDKANATYFAQQTVLATTANKVYSIKQFSVRQLIGNMPAYWGIWMTHGVTTGSSTPHSSGNTMSYKPCYGSYT
jgi:hypothetical protein